MTKSDIGGADDRPLALVVDDHADGRDIASRVLEALGLRIVQEANGRDALHRVRSERPAVVILDLALPGLDGWTVARKIKSDPATSDILIVGYTAHAERAPLERAREAGCDVVLTKPCPPRDLARSVQELLQSRRVQEEA